MKSKVTPPPGYTLMRTGDYFHAGDIVLVSSGWVPAKQIGQIYAARWCCPAARPTQQTTQRHKKP